MGGIDANLFLVVSATDLARAAVRVSHASFDRGGSRSAVGLRSRERDPLTGLPTLRIAFRVIHTRDGASTRLRAERAVLAVAATHLSLAHLAVIIP